MLEIDNVSFRYGRRAVLVDVNLSLGAGIHALLGRNGAGKTTLIKILVGAAAPSQGSVRFESATISQNRGGGRSALRSIGWLPQEFGYPPHMTVGEFVTYAAWLKEVPRARIRERVTESIQAVGLTESGSRPLRALSGGQLRRAGLAAAIVADPTALILDEPTAGLDPEQRDDFHRLVRSLHVGKVVVVATHLLEDVEALAENVVVLDSGAVRWVGTQQQLAAAGAEGPGVRGLRQGFSAVLGRAQ
ncbi:MAG TPA: ATP-binding cassette domain-containing protein [Pilimelia sp.]|nr:ATP-binding cassette domain-containing protein [Pilimelia sp.]